MQQPASQVAGGQLVGLCGKARRDEAGRESTLQHAQCWESTHLGASLAAADQVVLEVHYATQRQMYTKF
jgi:hypothetical protein